MNSSQYVVWFNEVDKDDIPLVGGKGANLGEMVGAGYPVPNGFIVTAPAYYYLIEYNKLQYKIKSLLKGVDVQNADKLRSTSQKVKNLIKTAEVPEDLAKVIIEHYLKLDKKTKEPLVAIRSSATAEDLPDASFAGQQETFLNIKGTANVVETIRSAWASLFEPRAIFYREQKGFDHFKVGIAVPVQIMVQSHISGVMFTVDPVTEEKDIMIIEAVWGLGELIVQGAVTPDRYNVEKGSYIINQKIISEQKLELKKLKGKNIKISVPKSRQKEAKLSDPQIKKLAEIGEKIQKHYFFPQDIEWAVEKGKIYILQTRPITTLGEDRHTEFSTEKLGRAISKSLKLLIKGDPASPGINSGPVNIIHSSREIGKIKKGDILVTEMTTPDFVPAMKKVIAIVTDKGGQTSHAAIVSRELGITCVVGTEKSTKLLKNGNIITVNGKTGEVFAGALPPRKIKLITQKESKAQIFKARKTATKVYVNLAEPDIAAKVALRNVDGVGLLRAEFMIAQIGVHPKKMIEDRKSKVFIEKLTSGLETFCRAFYPRPVVYRTTDFKTNEYRNLTGGKAYEPEEENPFLGYRGAFRYIADEAVFDMELKAIKKVRNKAGFKNLWLMIPFVRTKKELVKTKRIIASQDLTRSSTFKLWMMVEIPSNVILLEDFIDVGIDGVSVGSNDLTMLILGVDRDNQEISSAFNEKDPAVIWAFERIIKIANRKKITSSICGQAPSLYPDLTEKLVELGITSVSVSPDAIERTREIVYRAELKKIKKAKK